jgi:hypothetical protein
MICVTRLSDEYHQQRRTKNKDCLGVILLPFRRSLASRGTVNDQLRIVAAKALGNKAVPADRAMCFQYLKDYLQRDLAPLYKLSSGVPQSRLMIRPVDFMKELAAIDALFAPVPFGQHSIDETLAGR